MLGIDHNRGHNKSIVLKQFKYFFYITLDTGEDVMLLLVCLVFLYSAPSHSLCF